MFLLSSLTCNQIWLIPLVDDGSWLIPLLNDGSCGYVTKLKGGILRTRYVCKSHISQIRIWPAKKNGKNKQSGVVCFFCKILQIAKKKKKGSCERYKGFYLKKLGPTRRIMRETKIKLAIIIQRIGSNKLSNYRRNPFSFGYLPL